MGNNIGSTAEPACKDVSNKQEKDIFRFRVVEHLSWDNYKDNGNKFIFGHKKNKPIAGMKFKIKLQDGSIINGTTDADGVIEIPVENSLVKCEIIFEPENARMNNVYYLFHNKDHLEKIL